MIEAIRLKIDSINPINAQVFPVFTLLYDFSVYLSGLAKYRSVAFFAINKATVPQIIPIIPQQQHPTIENIPKTRIADALGRSLLCPFE